MVCFFLKNFLKFPEFFQISVQDFRVTFLEKELRPVSSARDLGMEFDECLSYDEHITHVVSKCTKSLCQINRVKHILDSSTLIVIINALVFCKLYYCSSVWANTSKKNIAKLQTVQNFSARIVTGTRKYDHITPVLQQLNWLPVSYMLQYKDTCDVTLSVYPHRASLKNMPGRGGNRTYDLWNTSPVHNTNTEKIILLDYIGIEGTRFCSEISLTRTDLTA